MSDLIEIGGKASEWRLYRRRTKDESKRFVAGPWLTREEADAQLEAAEKREKEFLREIRELALKEGEAIEPDLQLEREDQQTQEQEEEERGPPLEAPEVEPERVNPWA